MGSRMLQLVSTLAYLLFHSALNVFSRPDRLVSTVLQLQCCNVVDEVMQLHKRLFGG